MKIASKARENFWGFQVDPQEKPPFDLRVSSNKGGGVFLNISTDATIFMVGGLSAR